LRGSSTSVAADTQPAITLHPGLRVTFEVPVAPDPELPKEDDLATDAYKNWKKSETDAHRDL
jgi:hypothetical protein